jgi:hypothetical protein
VILTSGGTPWPGEAHAFSSSAIRPHTGAPEEFIVSVEEGDGFVIVLTRVASNEEPEFRYLSRLRDLNSYPSEVFAVGA